MRSVEDFIDVAPDMELGVLVPAEVGGCGCEFEGVYLAVLGEDEGE